MSGIDLLSSVPLFVEPRFGEQALGVATAFTYVLPDALMLITNWHVASGRNSETDRTIARHGGVPDRLRVAFPRKERRDEPVWVEVPTVDDDGRPTWIEHPRHGQAVDVVAFRMATVPDPHEVWVTPVNAIRQLELKQRVGGPLFIVGYPFGRTGFGMPVWKQGSFASEPYLSPEFETHPTVDSASRPGMSGSPVFQRSHGEVDLENGTHGRTTDGDGACRFVGVYSGRFHTHDQSDAQLGRVWPAQLVEEIVAQAARGDV